MGSIETPLKYIFREIERRNHFHALVEQVDSKSSNLNGYKQQHQKPLIKVTDA